MEKTHGLGLPLIASPRRPRDRAFSSSILELRLPIRTQNQRREETGTNSLSKTSATRNKNSQSEVPMTGTELRKSEAEKTAPGHLHGT